MPASEKNLRRCGAALPGRLALAGPEPPAPTRELPFNKDYAIVFAEPGQMLKLDDFRTGQFSVSF